MTTPTTEPGAGVRGRAPRQSRGFITSYGDGRTCADAGCETTLSRYNKSEVCWQHGDEFEASRNRHQS